MQLEKSPPNTARHSFGGVQMLARVTPRDATVPDDYAMKPQVKARYIVEKENGEVVVSDVCNRQPARDDKTRHDSGSCCDSFGFVSTTSPFMQVLDSRQP